MRKLLFGLIVTFAFALPAAAQLKGDPPTLPATDVTAKDIQAFLKALPRNEISDLPIRAVDVGGHRIGVYGVRRPKAMPGDAIAHLTKTTEVYYILDGAGVLVTGGVITDVKAPPEGRNAGPRGDKIEGGVSRRVSAGDMIVIPGRTPHWWSSLESDIHYLIVRSDPEGRMRLK
jgi:mannose-6-phosphate isomerase-like protein (cupin superfamily)